MTPVKRVRTKACDLCGRTRDTLYRVRHEAGGDWVFLCVDCQEEVSDGNPHYTYGGTWKSRKRH